MFVRFSVALCALALSFASVQFDASAQDRYAPSGLVGRLKNCIQLNSRPGAILARNTCDVTIHVLACARDRSGCDDSEVGPGEGQRLNVVGQAEYYACPHRADAVDMNDNPVTSAFVSQYRCVFL